MEKIEFLKSLYEASSEGIIIVDAKATIFWANKTVQEFTQTEMEGQNVVALLNSDEISWPPTLDEAVRFTFQGSTMEYIATPFPNNAHYIVSIRNLDNANGIKKEVEKNMEKTIGQFVHDIFSPLSGIAGILQQIEKGEYSEKETGEAAKVALSGVKSMLKNREVFLALNKISKGEYQIERKKIDLFQLIKRNKEIFEASSGIKISQRPIINAQFETMAEEPLLDIAIGNILKNAVEAMYEQGLQSEKITINFGQFDGMATIAVINPGHIPEKIRKKMFKEIFTTKRTGSGLGSRAIRLIAEAHGGGVSVKNLSNAVEVKITFPG